MTRYNVYPIEEKPFEATKVQAIRNELGAGYRIEAIKWGNKAIMFYKTDEIETIMQVKENNK